MLEFLEKICPTLPPLSKQLPKLPLPAPRTRIATPGEIEALLAHAKPELRVVLLLAVDCGLRYTEARTLAQQNLNAHQRTITFIQKGGSTRTMPVTSRILEHLSKAPDTGTTQTSFVERFHGRSISSDIPGSWFRQLKDRLGISRDLHIHDLRRTLATRAYDETHDLRIVQQVLGHASMASTLHYLAPHSPENLRPLIEALQQKKNWKH